MKKYAYVIMSGLLMLTPAVQAQDADDDKDQDINYSSLSEGGFADVAKLLKSMTPEQRAQVLDSAAIKQEDLKHLTPDQLQKLKTQLRAVADTIYMDKIDPSKLDISKSKDTDDTLKDLDTYQTKYEQGKINNSAVKPLDDGGQ